MSDRNDMIVSVGGNGDRGAPPVWEADVVALPSLGPAAGERSGFVALAEGGNLIHTQLLHAVPSEHEEIVAALEDALRAAVLKRGYLPHTVAVRHPPIAGLLARVELLRDVRVEPRRSLPGLEAALEGVLETAGTSAHSLRAARDPIRWIGWRLPDEVIAQLFRAAAAYWRARPWRVLDDERVLRIETRDGERWWGCVLSDGPDVGSRRGFAMFAHEGDVIAAPAEGVYADTAIALLFTDERSSVGLGEEVRAAGWEIADRAAVPELSVVNTPAHGVTVRQVRTLRDALRAVAEFVAAVPDVAGATAARPVEWRSPITGAVIHYDGRVATLSALSAPPQRLTPSLPFGPGAHPELLEEPYDPRRAERFNDMLLRRFRAWLWRTRRQRPRGAALEARHEADDFLYDVGAVGPLTVYHETGLRTYLYDDIARRHVWGTFDLDALARTIGWLLDYLADDEGLELPWMRPLLADRETVERRAASFPSKAPLWCPHMARWDRQLLRDLDARVMLPARETADGRARGDGCMNQLDFELNDELERHWMVWREEVIRGGLTDPDSVRAILVSRQHEWERTPSVRWEGATPLEMWTRAWEMPLD